MSDVKPGERLACSECGTEVVVIKAGGASPRCCERTLVSRARAEASAS
jgi:hypothetical protein